MKPSLHWALLAVVATALFCSLAVATLTNGMAGFDDAVRSGLHSVAAPTLTATATIVTMLGSLGVLMIIGAVAGVGLALRGRRDDVLLLVVTMAGALVLENTLKYVIQRPRPPPFFGVDPMTFSFPSGHALFSLCCYGILAVILVRRMHSPITTAAVWIAAAVLVTTIGATRVYLGVHYPSDVLGGYLVATAWVATVLAAERTIRERHPL